MGIVIDLAQSAILSEEQPAKYRYWLKREMKNEPNHVSCSQLKILFIMLNPSTADHQINDPTIRRCIGFTCRERGCTLGVVNLFALRSPSPADLRTGMASDPVGPENREAQERAIRWADKIICGWGGNIHEGPMWFRRLAGDQVETVYQIADKECMEDKLFSLGVSKKGTPNHPLYIPADQPLIPWRP